MTLTPRVRKLIAAILGAAATGAAVSSLISHRRRIIAAATGELPAAAVIPESAPVPPAPSEAVTAELSVDDSLGPDVMPGLAADLRLGDVESVAIRHVCLNWNKGRDECCAHVENVTIQSYVLNVRHPQATYLFDACTPVRLENATLAKDLNLSVYSAEAEEPILVVRRKPLLRHMERWLAALNSYYSAHGLDPAEQAPVAISRAA